MPEASYGISWFFTGVERGRRTVKGSGDWKLEGPLHSQHKSKTIEEGTFDGKEIHTHAHRFNSTKEEWKKGENENH